tara:strand:+ start:346 stop:1239 length:894 start_codon:yes stop_codon:yes gene_type:complete
MAKGVKLDLKASRAKRKAERKKNRAIKSSARMAMDKKMIAEGSDDTYDLQRSRAKKRVAKATDKEAKQKAFIAKLKKDAKGTKLQKGVTYDLKAERAKRKLQKIIDSNPSFKGIVTKHGGKVKAMKGSKVMYKDGGSLKKVPSDAKGLSKLPTSVRNKMGYMKNGGKVTDPPTKKKTQGGQLNPPSENKKMKKTVKDVPKTSTKYLENPIFRPSKEKGDGYMVMPTNPPKYRNMKTGKVISEAEYYKVTGKKKEEDRGMRELKNGGKVKAMYGAKMKKAMYGAKMKKAMYGAKMKKK